MAKTTTKTNTQTKCLKNPTYAIFLKSWWLTHSKYDDRYLTLVILFTPVTLITLFRSYNQFYRAECITVSGFFSCTSFSIHFLFSSAVTLYWPPRKQESSFSQPWKNRSGGWVSSSRTELFLCFLFHLCSADLFLNYCLIWKNSDVCTYGTSTKTLTLPTSMTLVC